MCLRVSAHQCSNHYRRNIIACQIHVGAMFKETRHAIEMAVLGSVSDQNTQKRPAIRCPYVCRDVERRFTMLGQLIDIGTAGEQRANSLAMAVLSATVSQLLLLLKKRLSYTFGGKMRRSAAHTMAANVSGEQPCCRDSAAMSAPRSSNSVTTAALPCRAAMCKGVTVSFKYSTESESAAPPSIACRAAGASPQRAASNSGGSAALWLASMLSFAFAVETKRVSHSWSSSSRGCRRNSIRKREYKICECAV